MSKIIVCVFFLSFLQGSKSEVYVSVISAISKKPTYCKVQVLKGNEILVDDYETNGNFKLQLMKGVYTVKFINCDTSQIQLRVINPVHKVGVFINDCSL